MLHPVISTVLATFVAKKKSKHSPPHLENDSPRSVNNFGTCIFRKIPGTRSQASTHKDMAAFIGRYGQNIPTTSSGTVITHFTCRATTQYS